MALNVDAAALIAKHGDRIADAMQKPQDDQAAPTTEEEANEPPVGESEAPKEGDAGTQQGDEGKAPEPAQGEDKAEQKFDIVVGGVPEKLTLRELVERAQKGTDYTKKTMTLAEKMREFNAVAGELEPWIKKAQQIRDQEREAEDSDPLVKAQKTAERAEAKVQALEDARLQDSRTREQSQYLENVVSQINEAKKTHKVFEKVKPGSRTERMVAGSISQYVVGGMTPSEAVSEVAQSLSDMLRTELGNHLEAKVSDAKKSPVPKPGAPAPSKNVRLTAKDLQDGKVAEAAMRRFK